MRETRIEGVMPPILQAYALRHGLEPVAIREDGGLVLIVDSLYRVLLLPAADGRLALTSLLLDLGVLREDRRHECLTELVTLAAGLVRDHPAALALDTGGERLVLQQVRTPSAQVGWLEDELAEFINVLAFWRHAVEQVAGWSDRSNPWHT